MAVDLGFLGTFGKVENPAEGASVSRFASPQTGDYSGGAARSSSALTPEQEKAAAEWFKAGKPDTYKGHLRSLGLDPGSLRYVEGVGYQSTAVFADPNNPQGPNTREQLAGALRDSLGRPVGAGAPQASVGLNGMRQGAQIDTSGSDYGQLLALGARNNQMDALRLQQQAAYGNAPSVAAVQQAQGLDAALSSQFALANSARGGAAQRAAAFGGAQAQAGQMQQAAVRDAAALRAAEMAQARDAYERIGTNVRAGDVGQAQLEAQIAQQQAGLNQQQQLANQQLISQYDFANIDAAQKQAQIDTARQLGLAGALTASDQLTLQAQLGSQGQYLDLLALQSGVAQANQQRNDRMAGGLLNTGGQIIMPMLGF